MTVNVIPLPFKGDLIDYLNINGQGVEILWRDREPYVAVKPICTVLGIDWKAQHRKLTSPESMAAIHIMTTTGADGKQYEMVCMAYWEFPLWLATIHPSKLKEGARDAFRRTRNEFAMVLANYLQERLLGEAVSRRQAEESFVAEWASMKSWRSVIVLGGRAGWPFSQVKAACRASTPEWRIAADVRAAMSLGIFTDAPAGLPAPRVVLSTTPANDPRQMPLFGGV